MQYAKDLGVGDVPSVPSLALGSGEVTLQSLTAAYAAFANRGSVPKPILIRRVEDRDGRVLYQDDGVATRAISESTAFLMANMMADVINAGTGARARALGFTLPAAGKTGTTNEYHDAWFVGFTPSLVAGVWVGFDQPRTIMPSGFASDVAVPMWATFMKAATRGDKPQWLHAARRHHHGLGLPVDRQARLRTRARMSRCSKKTGTPDAPLDGVHRIFRRAAHNRPSTAICTRAGGSSGASRRSSPEAAKHRRRRKCRTRAFRLRPAPLSTAATPPDDRRRPSCRSHRRRSAGSGRVSSAAARTRTTRRIERRTRTGTRTGTKRGHRQGQEARPEVIRFVSKARHAVSRRCRSSPARRLALAGRPARVAAAEPDPRRSSRHRQASGRGRHRTGAELQGPAGCGTCSVCTRIARGVHPDVLIVEPGDTGSIKIDQVRDIVDRAGYRPFEGRRRVVIIDDADALMPGRRTRC